MSRVRVPVWLPLVAAAFLGYDALLIYCDAVRPEHPGLRVEFSAEGAVIRELTPGSPAERAGLAAGDRVLRADGRPIAGRFDLEAVAQNFRFDRPTTFEVDRAGTRLIAPVVVRPAGWAPLRTREGALLLAVRGMLTVTLVFGLAIAVRRPRDPVALAAAALLSAAGVFSLTMPNRVAAVWRDLPLAIGAPLWVPFVLSSALGALGFVFFTLFPHRPRRSAIFWIAALAPIAVVVGRQTLDQLRVVYAFETPAATSPWPLFWFNLAYILVGLTTLIVAYRSLSDVNERRRVRVLVVGSIVGWLAAAPTVYSFYTGATDLRRSLFASTGVTIGTFAFLVFPLSFAYVTLRHRVFDVRVIIRQGVRYALARRALLSIVPALALVLVVDVLLHGDEPLIDVLRTRGTIYAAIAAAAIVAHTQRRHWIEALDRRFFRERFNVRQILGALVADIRKLGSFEPMAHRAVAHIDEALHPDFAAVLRRPAGGREFQVLAVVPAARTLAPIPAEATLIRLMRALNNPVDVGPGATAWLRNQLPREEIGRIRSARLDLLVPIAVDPAYAEAVLALGAKRSEEPYSREDRDLLTAIAESLALLIERDPARPAAASAASVFDECTVCGTVYDTGSARCVHDESELQPRRLPRLLASRYRLERRLGRGGMGTVYAAVDVALDRKVAAKVMREELLGDPHAAERFEQEARTAARFAHPNVVTVHDFGIASGTFAFLVMELLEGESLRGRLDRVGRLDVAETRTIMRQLTAAVEAAHRQQLLHRDLKPENLFLARSDAGEVTKVVDFGIAKSFAGARVEVATTMGATRGGMLFGTPMYMAPEQLDGGTARASWDLWAMALLACEMLTGVHPFARTPVWAVPGGAAGVETLIATRLSASPASIQAFFARALALDPSVRPASPRELLAAFEAALDAAP